MTASAWIEIGFLAVLLLVYALSFILLIAHAAQPEIEALTWLAQAEEICRQERENNPDFPGVLSAPGTRRTTGCISVRREKDGAKWN